MKYLANTLSLSRIVGAAVLLLGSFAILPIPPLSIPFFAIYIVCVITDIIDGPIARKTNTVTGLGSTLDSVADVILIFTVLAILIPILDFEMWMFICIAIVIVIRAFAITVGFKKFRTLIILHTYSSKTTSLLLACFPIFYGFFGIGIAFGIAAIAAIPSALDELCILIRLKELKRDVVSMFHVD